MLPNNHNECRDAIKWYRKICSSEVLDIILQLKRSIGDGLWCVLGDFIAITRNEKSLMRSNESQHGAKEIEEFNVFVDTWSWLICH